MVLSRWDSGIDRLVLIDFQLLECASFEVKRGPAYVRTGVEGAMSQSATLPKNRVNINSSPGASSCVSNIFLLSATDFCLGFALSTVAGVTGALVSNVWARRGRGEVRLGGMKQPGDMRLESVELLSLALKIDDLMGLCPTIAGEASTAAGTALGGTYESLRVLAADMASRISNFETS